MVQIARVAITHTQVFISSLDTKIHCIIYAWYCGMYAWHQTTQYLRKHIDTLAPLNRKRAVIFRKKKYYTHLCSAAAASLCYENCLGGSNRQGRELRGIDNIAGPTIVPETTGEREKGRERPPKPVFSFSYTPCVVSSFSQSLFISRSKARM